MKKMIYFMPFLILAINPAFSAPDLGLCQASCANGKADCRDSCRNFASENFIEACQEACEAGVTGCDKNCGRLFKK